MTTKGEVFTEKGLEPNRVLSGPAARSYRDYCETKQRTKGRNDERTHHPRHGRSRRRRRGQNGAGVETCERKNEVIVDLQHLIRELRHDLVIARIEAELSKGTELFAVKKAA